MKIINDYTPVNFNTSRSGVKIDTIIFHSMDGFYNGTISWFKNPASKASSHYLISKEGEIRRMVREEHRAWHAGTYNDRSIGIELEDERKREAYKYTEAQKEALRWLVSDIESRHGILKRVLHKDISANRSDPVGDFTLLWLTNSQPPPIMPDQDKKDIESMKNLRKYISVWYESKHVIADYEARKLEIKELQDAVGEKKKEISSLNADVIARDKEITNLRKAVEVAQNLAEQQLAQAKIDCQKKIDDIVDKNRIDMENLETRHREEIKKLKEEGNIVEVPIETPLRARFKGKSLNDKVIALLEILGA